MSFVDLVEGGGILPHVYCKKIILEREKVVVCNNKKDAEECAEQKTENINITMKLELLANSKNVHASWLSEYAPAGEGGKKSTLFNSLFIQVIPVVGNKVNILKPSYKPVMNRIAGAPPLRPNMYVSEQYLGKNWLPRKGVQKVTGVDTYFGKHNDLKPMLGFSAAPLQVSTSTTFGAGQPLSIKNVLAQGKLREEVRYGKSYYIVPVEFKATYAPHMSSLGYVFYSFLHVPHFLQANFDSIPDDSISKYEDYVIEGPVNTEIIFEDNNPVQTREAFMLPGGHIWEGSVHLHGPKNPSPADGYYGDGGFGFSRGWMAGKEHLPGTNQPKVELVEYPNYKIDDFRGSLKPPVPPNVLGIFSRETSGPELPLEDVGKIIGGFNKVNKKYFTRDDDDEYSNLYLTRDALGTTRGLFFINFENLLENNSSLFNSLTKFEKRLKISPDWLPEVLKKSKLIDLKLYRDRINKHSLGKGYENFKNDTTYEAPSRLVATIADETNYGTTSSHIGDLREVIIDPENISSRYFVFLDRGSHMLSAGVYQYRVEFRFKDGTYEFLNNFLAKVENERKKMQIYYNLSMSGVRQEHLVNNYRASLVSREYRKSVFKSYYDSNYGSFVPEFIKTARNTCEKNTNGEYIWQSATTTLRQIQVLLGMMPSNLEVGTVLASMINPEFGSPQGIDLFVKLFDAAIRRMQILTSVAKDKDGGADLTASNSSNFTNETHKLLSSPTKTTIYEEHTFDDPKALYKANSNNNVFVDYLEDGIAATGKVGFSGLRNLDVNYFRARCRLDAIKYNKLAQNESAFNTSNIGLFEPDQDYYNSWDRLQEAQDIGWSGPGMKTKVIISDNLAKTAYSYLTPSVVFYSDSTKRTPKYFSSFSQGDATRLLTGGDISLSAQYANVDYDSLYAEIINYSLTKKETDHADIRIIHDPFISKSGAFKTLAQRIGLTLHDKDLYSKFFDKEPGAVNYKIDGVVRPFDKVYPLKGSDFSDGGLNPGVDNVLTRFLTSKKQSSLRIPLGNAYPHDGKANYQRPNNFKLAKVFSNRKQYGAQANTPPIVSAALDDPISNNSFIFFHYNMTVKIEKFNGVGLANPKNDDNAWTLLTEGDLALVEDSENKKLFCRLNYHNKKLLGDVDIPMLNRYFFITKYDYSRQVSISLDGGLFNRLPMPANTLTAWANQNSTSSTAGAIASASEAVQGSSETMGAGGGDDLLAPGQQLTPGGGSSYSGGAGGSGGTGGY